MNKKKPRTSWCPVDPEDKRESPLAGLAKLCPDLKPFTDEKRAEVEKKLEEKLKPYRAGNSFIYIRGIGYMRR